MTSITCGYSHVVIDGTAHLSADDGSGVLCGTALVESKTLTDACPEPEIRHCINCEGVAIGNAVVLGGDLTYI